MELRNLRAIRHQRLLTQDELADAAGLTKASISRLETGATKARISTVRRLMGVLQADLDELTSPPPDQAQPITAEKKEEIDR